MYVLNLMGTSIYRSGVTEKQLLFLWLPALRFTLCQCLMSMCI